MDVENLGIDPQDLGAAFTSAVRRRARMAPAISWWPMSPLVTLTNLTLYPSLTQRAAVPPAASSQSSGWAPKTMIRAEYRRPGEILQLLR